MKRSLTSLSALCVTVLLATPALAAQQPSTAPSPMGSGAPTASATESPATDSGNSMSTPSSMATTMPMAPSGAMGTSGAMGSAPMKMPAHGDAAFVMNAAQGGMTEVKAAHIALQKSSNAKVKAYAEKMIADHTPNNEKLATIVKGEGRMLPGSVGAMHQMELSKLAATSGSAFDALYLNGQIADHKKMLALMQKEATSGTDPKLVAFAKMTAPTVRVHLSLASKDAATSM